MSLSVCPISVVRTPVERVWSLLAQPASYDKWWDAKTDSIVPSGPASPGQVIRAHARGLGLEWPIRIRVLGVDQARHQLDLVSSYPFGITLQNKIRVRPIDAGAAQVSFG